MNLRHVRDGGLIVLTVIVGIAIWRGCHEVGRVDDEPVRVAPVKAPGGPNPRHDDPAPARPPQPPIEEPAIDVTARQLFADYEANEISADDKYKGKTVRVTGTIASIGKDILGDAYVQFDVGDPVFGVQCMFDDGSALASLKKRQKLSVRCKDPGKLGNVILRGCVIASAAPEPPVPASKRRAKVEAPTPENRELFAQKLKAAVGDKGDVRVDGLVLVLSTPPDGERTCVSFKHAVLDTQLDRLRSLGFKQLKCEGDSIVSVIR